MAELNLYLDTHSDDTEAFELFKQYSAMEAEARKKYEETYGPLTLSAAAAGDKYNWLTESWPWNYPRRKEGQSKCFSYEKKLQYPVKIATPNPKLASFIISQYGGPDGELGASLRYLSQRYAMPYPELKGLLTDIGTEELGHLEMIGAIVHQLTRNLTDEQVREGGFRPLFCGSHHRRISNGGFRLPLQRGQPGGQRGCDLRSHRGSGCRAKGPGHL